MPTKAKNIAHIVKASCVACGTCYAVCPFAAMEIIHGCYAQPLIDKCLGCGTCARSCPTGCITIKPREVQP